MYMAARAWAFPGVVNRTGGLHVLADKRGAAATADLPPGDPVAPAWVLDEFLRFPE
jgi:hypothetical protein